MDLDFLGLLDDGADGDGARADAYEFARELQRSCPPGVFALARVGTAVALLGRVTASAARATARHLRARAAAAPSRLPDLQDDPAFHDDAVV